MSGKYTKGFRAKTIAVKTAKGRRLSSTNWLRRQLNDPYRQMAEKDGYRARSAYKILEIDDKYQILKSKNIVLDLGCAPGGWLQAIRERNKQALCIGVDLLEVENVAGVDLICGDFTDHKIQQELEEKLSSQKVDLIVSDIAPSTTGVSNVDCLRLLNIAEEIFTFSQKNLALNGDLVLKIFMGLGTDDFMKVLKQNFNKVSSFKPSSSRKDSKEIYLVAKGFSFCNEKKS